MSEDFVQDLESEDCECSCHDHGHEHHVYVQDADDIHVEHHVQDDARVISGVTRFKGDYRVLRPILKAGLETLAAKIAEEGGGGHIKAVAEVMQTEMFSVTDVDAMVKTVPTRDITVKLAAIVFGVEPDFAEIGGPGQKVGPKLV